MCMFQEKKVEPTNHEEVAYKVLYLTFTGKVVTPYQGTSIRLDHWMRARNDGSTKWNADKNPGFGVFKTETGAQGFCRGVNRILVKVRIRRVVTCGPARGRVCGCCAMEMFVGSEDNPSLVSRIKENKEHAKWTAKALKKRTT